MAHGRSGCGEPRAARRGVFVSERYARQTVLPEVGSDGQARIAAATVLVVGAGGLGSPVLQYLGGAGIGRLVIVDPDQVEESNLHRQPLYRMSDLGASKAQAAGAALRAANPAVAIATVPERLTPGNVAGLLAQTDLAVDATDSLAATYVLSDACQRAGKPLVSASVLGLAGYVGAFCGGAPSYRAVFPEMPQRAGSCSQLGVLGTAVGVIGTLQAQMVLSILLNLEPSVLGRLVCVDFRTLRIGGFSFANATEPAETPLSFIAIEDVTRADTVIDLRSAAEAPQSPIAAALRIGVDELADGACELPRDGRIVLCCRSGVRAWRAARALERRGHRHLALIAFG